MAQTIECPSGLTGEIRGLKVKEFNILANRRLAKSGEQIDGVLRSCWVSTIDPGPYEFAGDSPDWSQVLQGDRFYAFLKIWALGKPDYHFKVRCQAPSCGRDIEWTIALDDLPVRSLSDEARASFKKDNRFETQLPVSGKRVWFRLPLGRDERRFSQIQASNRERLWSAMLAFRVVEIEGVKDSDKLRFIEDLDYADAEFLRGEFDRVDCGVDTTIEIECDHCLLRQEVDLPFDIRFFLERPKTERQRRTGSMDFVQG